MSTMADKGAEAQEARAQALAALLDEEWDRIRADPALAKGSLEAARAIARLCRAVEVYAQSPASDARILAHFLRGCADLRHRWLDAYRERPPESRTVEDRDAALVLRLWRGDA